MSDHPMRRVTDEVTRAPASWRSFRDDVLATFDELAADWEERLGPDQLTALAAGLRSVPAPAHALDVACGTGLAADLVAGTFPEAVVVGLDLSLEMLRGAAAKRRPHPVAFAAGDASGLPCADSAFDLVTVLNGLVFAQELLRSLVPGGWLLVAFSNGERTPIYIPFEELETTLGGAGFASIRHGSAGPGTWTSARRPA